MPSARPLCCLILLTATVAAADPAADATVEFNRDVRPILADACFQCHGPDTPRRKADLRLDQEASAKADRDGHRVIAAGKPENSELLVRLVTDDAELRMPPKSTGKQLTPTQIETLRRWIAQGATWQKHWSLISPARPTTPTTKDRAWVKNPIDAFVLQQLEQAGLTPAKEADRATLLRRVTFDLTGLPPTIAETDAFLADESPDAYERVVDRLLTSSRFGERLAARWLDYARYADTNGYQSDGERHMWRWRDWVIEAFNANKPFDEFTIEQLAGDLLPNPTLDQQIATGFNRNHRGNAEGGIIPEEYAVEYVVDRVETTATVWMGLTLGCCRCHSHKYDPFTQAEFYELYAFFNSVPERGRAVKFGNSPPMIPAPTREQQRQLSILKAELIEANEVWRNASRGLPEALSAWAAGLKPGLDWSPTERLIGWFSLDHEVANRATETPRPATSSATITFGQATDTHSKKPGFEGGPAEFEEGRLGQSAAFDGQRFVVAGDAGNFGYYDKLTVAAWIHAGTETGTIVSRMTDKPEADGWYVQLAHGKVQVNLVKRWLDDSLRVETKDAIPLNEWRHVAVTYDGSREANGVQVFVNGEKQALQVNLDELNQDFLSKEPLRIGGGGGPDQRFHGRIDDVRIYDRILENDELAALAIHESLHEIAQTAPERRSPAQLMKLGRAYAEQFGPETFRNVWSAKKSTERRLQEFREQLPTVMVMQELPEQRPAHVLIRGEYDKPGERVQRDVPGELPAFPESAPRNRLGLAQWLVNPSHPLTARVTVNRFWQMMFGAGLVRTLEDFGSQGDWPSHPDLLDWLATEFTGSGWDVKHVFRTIVTSATYRQSSWASTDVLQRDPENRLLSRGPRGRLSAEGIRDQALFVSGLLSERSGGPSVMPYQPEGLWKDLATLEEYPQSHGADLYRRSLYTYWKRTVAPPAMMTFDASGRETCVVRETRTNTPLQALALLNDTIYLESARKLAERVLLEPGTTRERLAQAVRLCCTRQPSTDEIDLLERSLTAHRARFQADRKAAAELIAIGESPRHPALEPAELAAWTAVMNVLFNLDETITKP